ncbi:dynein regulatory complex subunit 2 isoform X1 [Physcomitrium patens]|uniref:dynein regulatory complex subunit 2 isoform X1 n=1 Tax=Physcomitrium patens TaxID=3218 RepID=UPI000D16F433|nr:coiled-coil domain-containing protein 65 homolog [Physcomitrium patens]XP_024370215.1 coiled-coil domain-containing protein 65 homolog [Physcomitrium patens]|eukprot:XP_024370214.1 coiled-coil domain-containing protein 65 homolog [Physcomitrella patens]
MAPKSATKKKAKKKPLTEEEKKAKADFDALKAVEMRKKAIRDRKSAFKNAMIDEEKLSVKSMLEIHKKWRSILRIAKIKEQRDDIDWLTKNHVRQMELKDHIIGLYREQLYESEAQRRSAQIKHLSMLDASIDIHYLRTAKMEEEFQEQVKNLEDSFMTERKLMTTNFSNEKKELKDVILAMKVQAEESIYDRRQVYEATREELKNKDIEEFNMLKITLELGVEEIERRIERTHKSYLANTEATTISFKNLVAKDIVKSHLIERRMRTLINLHENISYWRVRMVIQGKEFNKVNQKMKDEKECLLNHYTALKRLLGRIKHHERDNLKEVSRNVSDAKNHLMDKLVVAQRVLHLAKRANKLETEHEKIFPFEPLHCFNIPTVPGLVLDRELAEDETTKKSEAKMLGHSVALLVPTQFQVEPKPPEVINGKNPFHWGTYALDENGNEVEESHYMANFNKRFNKVKLDLLTIQTERNRLSEENSKLINGLQKYMDSQIMPK